MSLGFSMLLLPLSKLFCEDFETLVILSTTLLPIKSLVVSAVFWIALFEACFIASVVDFLATIVACVAVSRSFWLHLLVKLAATLVACVTIFLANDKNP